MTPTLFELRPYQTEAVDRAVDALHDHSAVACILPTGSGKTEIFIELARRLTRADDQASILVLSHLSLLTDQTRARFADRAKEIRCSILRGDEKPTFDSRVIISTMQTTRREHHVTDLKTRLLRPPKYLFIDEAHMLETPSYNTIRALFPEAKLIGFTATPFRSNQVMTSIFDTIAYSISMQELIDQGYLVPPKVEQIIDVGDTHVDRMASVLGLYQAHERGNRAIVYMSSIQSAKQMRNAFDEIGIPAAAITDDISAARRDAALIAFKEGTTRVLTTVNVLTAGFDAPAIRAIFLPYGTKSAAAYLQRIGRGLRPDPASGKTHCTVYVAGNAPSVSQKAYQRLTATLLQAGGKTRDYDTYTDDLEFNDYSRARELQIWNSAVVDAVRRMEQLGMPHFAGLLNAKQFPKRFVENITALAAALPAKKSSMPHGEQEATPNQIALLFREGFASDQLKNLTKAEASSMIQTLVNAGTVARTSAVAQRFLVPEGKHVGKHVSELPFAYRSQVLKRFPDSPVARIIREYDDHKRGLT